MSWTLRLPFEILEEFEAARRAHVRQGRTSRERLFDGTGIAAERVRGAREWRRATKARLKPEREARAVETSRAMATIPAPAVFRASCVACRREVEVREGCKTPVAHEPCVTLRPGKKGGRKRRG